MIGSSARALAFTGETVLPATLDAPAISELADAHPNEIRVEPAHELRSDTVASPSGNQSDPHFLTHHALRIKGFAKVETLAEITALPAESVESHLSDLAGREWAMFREARALWQLTPSGKSAHPERLAADIAAVDLSALAAHYHGFLELNSAFKVLCGDWQLRDGAVNDHSDSAYDRKVIDRLVELDAAAQPIVAAVGGVIGRFAPYAGRLASTCGRVRTGETNLFTGVMCGSYHDVWMELHEDLILTQGIDRSAEGSF